VGTNIVIYADLKKASDTIPSTTIFCCM